MRDSPGLSVGCRYWGYVSPEWGTCRCCGWHRWAVPGKRCHSRVSPSWSVPTEYPVRCSQDLAVTSWNVLASTLPLDTNSTHLSGSGYCLSSNRTHVTHQHEAETWNFKLFKMSNGMAPTGMNKYWKRVLKRQAILLLLLIFDLCSINYIIIRNKVLRPQGAIWG